MPPKKAKAIATLPEKVRKNQEQKKRPSRCQTCGLNGPPMRVRSMRQVKLSALDESAKVGCPACSILRRGIKKVLNHSDDFDKKARNSVREVVLKFSDTTTAKDFSILVEALELEISVFAWADSPWLEETIPRLPVARELPNETSSEEGLEWVLDRLRNCNENHKTCGRLLEPSASMPSRVLDVGQSEADYVKLLNHGGPLESYVALSHCWGKIRLIRTLSTNIDEHRQRIPWGSLPPTFRETISYVRRLGVRYLWIDSLCIIQDDSDDWAKEAAKMASVYQNADLVISATKSAGSDEGLFAKTGDRTKSYTVTSSDNDGLEHKVCFRRTIPRPDRSSKAFPTLSRGWIFQERFLSRRLLHFGPQELFWECLEESACQCTAGSPEPVIRSAVSPAQKAKFFGMDQHHLRPKAYINADYWADVSEVELRQCWRRIVGDFTRLRLTFELDVFPAMSGIAKSFQGVRKSQYLAGLWEKTLLDDLLWHRDTKASPADTDGLSVSRPEKYRAPTWSWASVQWPITFLGERHHDGWNFLCDVVAVDCTLANADPTGRITDGQLLSRGHLIPAILEDGSGDWNWYRYQSSVMEQRGVKVVYFDYDVKAEGPGKLASGSKLHYLIIGMNGKKTALSGLILAEEEFNTEKQCSVFKRVGLIEVTSPSNVETNWFGDFLPANIGKALVQIV